MKNKIYSFSEIKSCLIPVFEQYGIKKAILFGSYGKGTATMKSDIDLIVDSGLKGLRFVGLIEEVRNALGEKEIDMFDVSHIEKGSRIEREIEETGVKIYGE